jgi:hypothetical protein
MDRQSAPPGPEIGWAFGGLGFVVTVAVGWLLSAGIGFVLFAMVFWGGVGALFAFLVERSTIEEHDRVDELQNTRLATLAPASGPLLRAAAPAEDAGRARSSTPAPASPSAAVSRPPAVAATTAGAASSPGTPSAVPSSEPERAPAVGRTTVRADGPVPDAAAEPAPRTPRERREAERRRRAAA